MFEELVKEKRIRVFAMVGKLRDVKARLLKEGNLTLGEIARLNGRGGK